MMLKMTQRAVHGIVTLIYIYIYMQLYHKIISFILPLKAIHYIRGGGPNTGCNFVFGLLVESPFIKC